MSRISNFTPDRSGCFSSTIEWVATSNSKCWHRYILLSYLQVGFFFLSWPTVFTSIVLRIYRENSADFKRAAVYVSAYSTELNCFISHEALLSGWVQFPYQNSVLCSYEYIGHWWSILQMLKQPHDQFFVTMSLWKKQYSYFRHAPGRCRCCFLPKNCWIATRPNAIAKTPLSQHYPTRLIFHNCPCHPAVRWLTWSEGYPSAGTCAGQGNLVSLMRLASSLKWSF